MTMTSIMRSFKGLRILLVLSILLLGVGSVWANTDKHYYAQLTTKVASNSTGGGLVYASTTSSAPASGDYGTDKTSDKQDSKNSAGGAKTFYAFAKASDGYSFTGWYTGDNGSGECLGSDLSISVVVNASPSSGGTNTKTIYATFAENKAVSVTFVPGTNGSYTVNGTKITSSQSITCEGTTALEATAASGYKFFGWYTSTDGGATKSYFANTASVSYTFLAAATVYAEFIPSSKATFMVKGTSNYYYDFAQGLTAAASSTSKVLVVASNGSVPAGTYTIPSGVTLLVPYDDGYTVKTTKPAYTQTSRETISLYKKLTLASGVVLNVSGSISVGGKACASNGGSVVAGMSGPFGQIYMNSGSSIVLNSGANLYCWGYISGAGTIDAKSGSNVYEPFQFDFRGGSHLSKVYQKCFPVNQYFVQNIEAPITFRYGSTETLYSAFTYTVLSVTTSEVTPVFIGSSGLFRLGSGAYLTKRYDGATDRQIYELYGDASINSISMNVAGYSLTTTSYILPITNNMDVYIHSGTTTVEYDVSLLADCNVTIDNGATLNVKKNLYVYDRAEWVGKKLAMSGDLNIPYYAVGRTYTSTTATGRTSAKMKSAKLNVNGTILLASSAGMLYTTETGGDICSETNGAKVVLTNSTGQKTSIVESVGTTQTTTDVPITPAKLHNSNAFKTTYGAAFEYLATAGAAAGTTVSYANGHWGWVEVWKDEDGTILKTLNTCTQQSGTAPTPPTPANMTFAGWSTVTSTANQEVVHTATYASPSYTITWVLDGKTVKTEDVAYGETPSYGSTPTKPSSERYDYKFSGWTPAITPVTGPQTYSGSFNATPRQYTIRFLNDDGSVLQEDAFDWGSQPVYTGATPQSTIVDGWFRRFVGWSPEVQLVETAVDYTAQYELVTLLDVPDEQTIPVDASVTTTTVYVTGALHVTESKTLTTEDLILKATPTTSGEILGRVTAANAYFDLSQDGDESHLFEAMRWYAVAVPWAVDAASGVSVNGATLTLGRDYDIIYYDGAVRAARGRVDACWRYVRSETDKTLLPGRAYMLILLRSGAKTLRFTRSGNVLHTESVGIRTYTLQTGNLNDANWNGIANPETYHAWLKMTTDVDQLVDGHLPHKLHFGQTYNADLEQYELVDLSLDASQLVVGKPIYVQATANQTAEACVNKVDAEFAAAPRRARTDAAESPYYDIHIAADGRSSDHIYIHTEEDKDDAYVLGADLSRFSVSSKVAQLWINRYDTRLCVNTTTPVNGSAVWSLGLSVPEAGEYQLYVATPVAEDDNLYLTYDGRVIWNLGHAPYTVALEAGQSEHYGLRLIHSAPDMEMDVDRVEATDAASVRKVLIDNRVYILRGAQLYTPAGQLLR